MLKFRVFLVTVLSKLAQWCYFMVYEREQAQILRQRLKERPSFINIVAGPRQVGKSTMVRQVLAGHSSIYLAADRPVSTSSDAGDGATVPVAGSKPTAQWLVDQWGQARVQASKLPENQNFVIAVDEVQKIPSWSELVKGLWDEDRDNQLNMHVVLLGSSPWLMQQGLAESLAGRYELIPMTHWSYPEMQQAFDFTLDEYIYFGGYPGAAHLIRDGERWRNYVAASLITPNIDKDILQMTRVDKPALLKAMFELGTHYSGQIIALKKMKGELEGAGNEVTLADYLQLLTQAGLLAGLKKFAGQEHRQRASPPKFNVLNTALMSALTGYSFEQAKADRSYWGRLVESAVGAHLFNTASDNCQLHYWRESPHEVDFILADKHCLTAIEVKSASGYAQPKGLAYFATKYKQAKLLIVGEGGLPLTECLYQPAAELLNE